MPNVDFGAPCYKVFVDGAEVPAGIYTDIITCEVRDSLNLANMITLTLANKKTKYSGGSDFGEGKVLKVEMGYRDHTEALCEGEIVAIEPVFPLKGSDTVVIRAYDRMHRLRYGRKRRAWGSGQAPDQTYKMVIDKVAQDLGLTADYGDTPPTDLKFNFIFQNNEFDIDFVKRIAREIGYEVDVDNSKLLVRKPLIAAAKSFTLTWGEQLKSFTPRLNTMAQITGIVVRGWDPKARRPIIGKAKVSDLTNNMKGKGVGLKETGEAFKGEILTKLVYNPVADQAEAEALAKAELNQLAMDYLTGEGTSLGHGEIRAGKVLELKGLGETFSGWYYVTEAVHTFVPGAGYATGFKVARPAWGLEPPPPPTPQRPPAPTQAPTQQAQEIRARAIDQATGQPIGNAQYQVVDSGGKQVAGGTTDYQGNIQTRVETPGQHQIQVTRPNTPPGGPPATTPPSQAGTPPPTTPPTQAGSPPPTTPPTQAGSPPPTTPPTQAGSPPPTTPPTQAGSPPPTTPPTQAGSPPPTTPPAGQPQCLQHRGEPMDVDIDFYEDESCREKKPDGSIVYSDAQGREVGRDPAPGRTPPPTTPPTQAGSPPPTTPPAGQPQCLAARGTPMDVDIDFYEDDSTREKQRDGSIIYKDAQGREVGRDPAPARTPPPTTPPSQARTPPPTTPPAQQAKCLEARGTPMDTDIDFYEDDSTRERQRDGSIIYKDAGGREVGREAARAGSLILGKRGTPMDVDMEFETDESVREKQRDGSIVYKDAAGNVIYRDAAPNG